MSLRAVFSAVLQASGLADLPMITAALAPKAIFPSWIQPTLTEDQKRKQEELQARIYQLGKEMDLDCAKDITFRTTDLFEGNAAAVGSTFALGGSLVLLGKNYLDHLVAEENSPSPEWAEWNAFIEACPNDPDALVTYINNLSQDQRERYHTLAKEYHQVMSAEELDGALCHEMGHIKHNHQLKRLGVAMIGRAAAKAAVVGALTLLKASDATRELYLTPVTILGCALLLLYTSRRNEQEADAEVLYDASKTKDVMNVFKKKVVYTLLDSGFPSAEMAWLKLPTLLSTHPSTLSRFQAFAQHLETKDEG